MNKREAGVVGVVSVLVAIYVTYVQPMILSIG